MLLSHSDRARPTETRRRPPWRAPPRPATTNGAPGDQARSRRRSASTCIFTDEHEDLRESMKAWVQKELYPHRNEWEETLLAERGDEAGRRARLPRPLLPRGVRRTGRRLLLLAGPRRVHELLGLGRDQHGLRRPDRHGPAADPPARHRGAEAALPRARDQGREDRLPRDHRAGRRLRRRRHPHDRDPRRRRVRDQRLEDVHHQRPARRLHRPRRQDRPEGAPRRA